MMVVLQSLHARRVDLRFCHSPAIRRCSWDIVETLLHFVRGCVVPRDACGVLSGSESWRFAETQINGLTKLAADEDELTAPHRPSNAKVLYPIVSPMSSPFRAFASQGGFDDVLKSGCTVSSCTKRNVGGDDSSATDCSTWLRRFSTSSISSYLTRQSISMELAKSARLPAGLSFDGLGFSFCAKDSLLVEDIENEEAEDEDAQ
ncbi:unnamed protein product [Hydatigera taeniaeformis]|uniref:Uncharacterized protein n=1 Tax=Hydatigena taeniaeformis TaxID=6205 RepID=A0A0R3X8V8_HYDTA|nr:unnamed protein product [Hydatigera taeniaeformis]